MGVYTTDFYKAVRDGSLASAEIIVPLVLELVKPKSVIDIGCGEGNWLSVFRNFGVKDILGVDGDWVDQRRLQIPGKYFLLFDLTKPLKLEREFDLVISLEVAEHLPMQCAEPFIDSLVSLGSVVLFSAAIPLQGGDGHVNEQWQDFWAARFEERGYVVIDCLRKQVWNNDNVEFWYAQNIFLFTRQDILKNYPSLREEFNKSKTTMISVVHPEHYLRVINDPNRWSLIKIMRSMPFLIKRAMIRKVNRYFKTNISIKVR
jgi:SAM-dependent methyltransferase